MSNTPPPLVSVIIPAYNSAPFVAQAIESVLTQSLRELELIVIDDGSRDETLKVASTFRTDPRLTVRWHEGHLNRGVSYSRYLGVTTARGQWIAFLDADDWFARDKLERQIDALSNWPKALMCHTDAEVVNSEGAHCPHPYMFKMSDRSACYSMPKDRSFLKHCNICHSSTLVRSSIVKSIDFRIPSRFFEDWFLWVLVGEKGQYLYLPEKLTFYRWHPASNTSALNQPTKMKFGLLEFYLSVLSRSCSERVAQQAAAHARATLDTLLQLLHTRESVQEEVDISSARKLLFAEATSFDLELARQQIDTLTAENEDLNLQLRTIRSSRAWRLLQRCRTIMLTLKATRPAPGATRGG